MAKFKYYDGSSWVELAKKSDIPSLSGYATQQWVQNQGYITSSGSCAYATSAGSASSATSAGNADTVDSEHADAFAHRGVGNNLITAGNEFNFIADNYGGESGADVWINYTTPSRNNSAKITGYILGDGHAGQLGVLIHSGNISSYAITSLSGYATQSWVENKGYITSSALSSYLPLTGGTLTGSNNDTPLTIKNGYSGETHGGYIRFQNNSGTTLGYFSVNSSGKPVFYDSADREIITSATIGNQSVNYATSAGSAPASDVYAWAKASTKPSYTASEVGALSSSTKYGKSLSISGTSLSLKDQDGSTLSTITVPSGGTQKYIHNIFIGGGQSSSPVLWFSLSFALICDTNANLYAFDYLVYMMAEHYGYNYSSSQWMAASGYYKTGSTTYIVTGVAADAVNQRLHLKLVNISTGSMSNGAYSLTPLSPYLSVTDNYMQL